MISKKSILTQLKKVEDPELGINIVDLGLIYDVQVKNKNVFILMTLTFPGCPLAGIISEEVKKEIGRLKGVGEVSLKITFDPPWSADKMSEEVQANLGLAKNLDGGELLSR